MTASNIALTEGGGAKKIRTDQRTISAIAVESQHVLLDEPVERTYVAIANSISSATTADHVLQIMSAAATIVRINRIVVYQHSAAGAAGYQGLQVFRLSTAGTGGTVVTPRPLDSGDAAASSTAMTLPSAKGTEGVMLWFFEFDAELTRPFKQPKGEWYVMPRGKPIVIPAGATNGIAFKVATGVASATLTIHVEYTETAWL